jgi:hypothetical protein
MNLSIKFWKILRNNYFGGFGPFTGDVTLLTMLLYIPKMKKNQTVLFNKNKESSEIKLKKETNYLYYIHDKNPLFSCFLYFSCNYFLITTTTTILSMAKTNL